MEDIYSSKERKKAASKHIPPSASPTENVQDSMTPAEENTTFSDYSNAARLAAEREFENAGKNAPPVSFNYNTNRQQPPRDVYARDYSEHANQINSNYSENLPSNQPPKREDPPKPKRKKKHFKTIKKILIAACSLILVAAIALGAVINGVLGSVNYNQTGHKKNAYVDESKLYSDRKVTNILLVGVDRRKDNVDSRSDTIMLLSIDRKNNKIKMTSFLRDSWVDIPGKRHAKLNSACTWGGVQLLMDTLEYNFNVQIDHYVMVDFKMFQDIVNKLGGIDVEVTEKEAKYMRDKVHLDVKAGKSEHLDGNEALWYCRIRYLDTDFKRAERQRKVLTAIISKVKQQSPAELLKIVKEVLPDIETDMTKKDLAALGTGAIFKYMRYDLVQSRVPKDGTWKNAKKKGLAVLELDINANKKYLYDFIYGKEETITETTTD